MYISSRLCYNYDIFSFASSLDYTYSHDFLASTAFGVKGASVDT